MAIESYEVSFPEPQIQDLKQRLSLAKFPDEVCPRVEQSAYLSTALHSKFTDRPSSMMRPGNMELRLEISSGS